MVGDEHELPRAERLVDRARGVRDDERAHAELPENANAEDRAVGADALVEMGPPAEHRDRHAVDGPEHEHARVSDRGGGRPTRDLGVRHLDAFLDLVGEPAEPAPENHADARLERRRLADPRDRLLEHQVEPSAIRVS